MSKQQNITESDPRSVQRFEWIKKYREVIPPDLDNSGLKSSESKSALQREISTGLEPYEGPWEEIQVKHLLNRTLFGITKTELGYFKSIPLQQAVDEIVSTSPIPEPPVNDYEGLGDAADPHVGFGESWLDAPHGGSKEGLRVVSLKNWLIGNIINQESTIHEKMVMFWSNLLVTKVWDVYMAKASYRYFQLIYNNALGNYRTFIKLLTLDPAMLVFLNGAKNTSTAPDENYGRELQELFCIGKGPESKYTELDVQSAARVLTGWTIRWNAYDNEGQFTSYFDHFKHYKKDKKFSPFYNNKVIKVRLGGEGAKELDELLDMIFDNEETAKYICRRIYSFFVYNDISETVEENVITPLAEIFRNNNYDIEPVLKTLFKSAHFFDTQNYGVLIKSPVDHLLGLWRTLDLDAGEPDDLLSNYEKRRALLWNMSGTGMEMGDPPNVAGWTAYYQAPQFDKAWITTNTITRRAKATDALTNWGLWISSSRRVYANLIGFVDSLTEPSDPVHLLEEATFLLLGLEISEKMMNNLKSILLSGQQNSSYWTSAWNNYKSNPENITAKNIVENRLKSTFRQMLQLAEFHLM